MEEIITLVKTAPRENKDVDVNAHDCDLFRRHFSRCFYQVAPAAATVLRSLQMRCMSAQA